MTHINSALQYEREPSLRRPERGVLVELSPREQQVLKLRAQGWTFIEIARELNIDKRTASNHCYNLMRKLKLDNERELIAYAWRNGVVK